MLSKITGRHTSHQKLDNVHYTACNAESWGLHHKKRTSGSTIFVPDIFSSCHTEELGGWPSMPYHGPESLSSCIPVDSHMIISQRYALSLRSLINHEYSPLYCSFHYIASIGCHRWLLTASRKLAPTNNFEVLPATIIGSWRRAKQNDLQTEYKSAE